MAKKHNVSPLLAEALHSLVGQIVQGRHGPTTMQLLLAINALREAAQHDPGCPIPTSRVEELQRLVEASVGLRGR